MENLEISILVDDSSIKGNLTIVPNSTALVVFVHGSGSSRFSSRNQFVAQVLNGNNISTLLFDLLTEQEEQIDQVTRQHRFDIEVLVKRLVNVTKWLKGHKLTKHLKLGYFGASTGAAAALVAAAELPNDILAVVSRGGRADLAGDYLRKVKAATLLIVGELDPEVIEFNKFAFAQLNSKKTIVIIPKATHLFEEPGTLEEAAKFTVEWFVKYLIEL